MSTGRSIRDAAWNVGTYAVALVATVFFTPYLVRTLGVEAFGVIPLTQNAVQYLSIFTAAFQTSVGRDLILALGRDDQDGASAVMSSAVFGTLAFCVVSALPLFVGAEWIDTVFRIPAHAAADARMLARLSVVTLYATAIAGVLESASFARGRFDARMLAVSGSTVLRTLVALALFEAIAPRLVFVGVGQLIGAAFQLTVAVFFAVRLLPDTRISASHVSRDRLHGMTSLGLFVVVNHLGTLLFLNADLFVVNRVLGAERAGDYALVLVWNNVLVAIGSAVANAFGPAVLSALAKGDDARSQETIADAVRFVSTAMALPVGLVVGLSEPLMRTWQGDGFAHVAPVLSTTALLLGLSLGCQPLASVFLGTGKLRVPSIVQLAAGSVSVLAGYLLARHTSLGLFAPALGTGIGLALRSCLFTPVYAAYALGMPAFAFGRTVAASLVPTIAVAVLARATTMLYDPTGWARLVATGAALSAAYALYAFRFGPLARRPGASASLDSQPQDRPT